MGINVELKCNFRGEVIHPGSNLNTIWLIFRNLFPVMHHLPSIWLRNIAQTDLYVLDVAPGTWYLSKRRLFRPALVPKLLHKENW